MKYKDPRLLLIERENGEITKEPLRIIAANDPVKCAIYARENGLLDQPGWKQFKHIAKNEKKFTCMNNQAKLKSFHTAPKYKYGYEIPRTYEQAKQIDAKNGNILWGDATVLELNQIDEYMVITVRQIRVHLVYEVKQDGRHKARLVADGHLTDIPLDSVYSGVVS
jgi:hypothetical protein